MTIPYLGGSTVAFLPLQNITSQYQSMITSTSVNVSSLLPPSADPFIISGYIAQTKLLQSLYSSSHAAVAEIAWEGGDTLPLAIIRPSSRGSININTTDPTAAPVIDFNTFSHPIDMAIAIAFVKKIREWASSPPMQAIGTVETFPGANVSTDSQIEEAIRNAATSSWQHPTSTTAMMTRELGGVVDAELRVYSTKGLRVVDAGIFPMSVAGHSSSSVYAVAEKVSLSSWMSVRDLRDAIADMVIGGRYHQSCLEVGSLCEFRGCGVERCFPTYLFLHLYDTINVNVERIWLRD
jgi:choline dehydrogenase-like flavoprotein